MFHSCCLFSHFCFFFLLSETRMCENYKKNKTINRERVILFYSTVLPGFFFLLVFFGGGWWGEGLKKSLFVYTDFPCFFVDICVALIRFPCAWSFSPLFKQYCFSPYQFSICSLLVPLLLSVFLESCCGFEALWTLSISAIKGSSFVI